MSCLLKTKTQYLRKVSHDKHINRMTSARSKRSGQSSDSKYLPPYLKNISGSKFSENIKNDHTTLSSKGTEKMPAILQQRTRNLNIENVKRNSDANKLKTVQGNKPNIMPHKENACKIKFNRPRTSVLHGNDKLSGIQRIRGKNISNKQEKCGSTQLDEGLKRETCIKSNKKDFKATKNGDNQKKEKVNARVNQICGTSKVLKSSSRDKLLKVKNIPLKVNPQNYNRLEKASPKCVLTQPSRKDEKWLNHREKCIGDMADNVNNNYPNQENQIRSEKDLTSSDSNFLNYVQRNLSSDCGNCQDSNTIVEDDVPKIVYKKNNKVLRYSEWRKRSGLPIRESSMLKTRSKKESEDLSDCNTGNVIKKSQQQNLHQTYEGESNSDTDHLKSQKFENTYLNEEIDLGEKPNSPEINSSEEQLDQENIQFLRDEEDLSSESYSISSTTSDNSSFTPEERTKNSKKEIKVSTENQKSTLLTKNQFISSPSSQRKLIDKSQIWIQFAKAYAENSNIYRHKRQLHRSKLFDKPVLNLGPEVNLASEYL